MRPVLNIEFNMFIYKITNIINGKVYIGQTIRPIKDRFKRHINDALNNVINTHFSKAIRKYGKDNFIIEQIDIAQTQDELNKKEQYYIRLYNSIKEGYNETDSLYKCGGNTYSSKTEEEMYDIALKISRSKEGIKNPNHKRVKVLNVDTNEELFFDTVNECRIFFNEKHHKFITCRVNGTTKSLYKGVWNIAYADNDYFDLKKYIQRNKCNIEVIDIVQNKKYSFVSIRNMCRVLDINRKKIRNGVNTIIDNFIIKFN